MDENTNVTTDPIVCDVKPANIEYNYETNVYVVREPFNNVVVRVATEAEVNYFFHAEEVALPMFRGLAEIIYDYRTLINSPTVDPFTREVAVQEYYQFLEAEINRCHEGMEELRRSDDA
uniref:Uncharacterized protein n=1 Tax=Trichuris muris TaxID=70415 RepID=A0A5S6R5L6_TRIMR